MKFLSIPLDELSDSARQALVAAYPAIRAEVDRLARRGAIALDLPELSASDECLAVMREFDADGTLRFSTADAHQVHVWVRNTGTVAGGPDDFGYLHAHALAVAQARNGRPR